MLPEELKGLLDTKLPGCHSQVNIQGTHFNILVVSKFFAGKRAVQRQ